MRKVVCNKCGEDYETQHICAAYISSQDRPNTTVIFEPTHSPLLTTWVDEHNKTLDKILDILETIKKELEKL